MKVNMRRKKTGFAQSRPDLSYIRFVELNNISVVVKRLAQYAIS